MLFLRPGNKVPVPLLHSPCVNAPKTRGNRDPRRCVDTKGSLITSTSSGIESEVKVATLRLETINYEQRASVYIQPVMPSDEGFGDIANDPG